MMLPNEVPWVDYLIIDDDGNRKLQDDTPQDIKEAYEKHLKEIEYCNKVGIAVAK